MTELPRIPATGPGSAIKPVKPVRKPVKDPKRPQRERPNRDRRKGREHSDADETAVDDAEPGKGTSINLRV